MNQGNHAEPTTQIQYHDNLRPILTIQRKRRRLHIMKSKEEEEEETLRELLKRKSEDAKKENDWEEDFWQQMENCQP